MSRKQRNSAPATKAILGRASTELPKDAVNRNTALTAALGGSLASALDRAVRRDLKKTEASRASEPDVRQRIEISAVIGWHDRLSWLNEHARGLNAITSALSPSSRLSENEYTVDPRAFTGIDILVAKLSQDIADLKVDIGNDLDEAKEQAEFFGIRHSSREAKEEDANES